LENRASLNLKRFLIIASYMAVSAVPIAVGLFRPGVTGYKRAMLEDMVYGKAYRPFVQRQLVPIIVRAGVWILPEQLEQKLEDKFFRSTLVNKFGWPKDYAAEFVLTLGVMYVSLIAFLVVLKRFLSTFLHVPKRFLHLIVLLIGIGLPVTFAGQMYIYDFTQLLFFSLGILLLYEQKWSLFYPVYILACINKETSILLPFLFLCWKGMEIFRKSNVLHFTVQVVIGFGIYFLISYIFRNNPGGSMEWHLERNLKLSFSTLAWVRLSVLVVLIVLSVWSFSNASVFLRRGFLATLAPLLVLTLFFGYIDELRDYYEALPFTLCLCLLTVGKPFDIRAKDQI